MGKLINLLSVATLLLSTQSYSESLNLEQDRRYSETVRRVIEDSRRSGYSLLVNKQDREAYLFQNGSIDTTFNVGLSIKPEGDKLYEGDGKTPEGVYRIDEVKDGTPGKTSRFGLALLLNYPTSNDKKEFLEAKSKGLVPDEINSPGSYIEIHSGPDNIDWTIGCVAISEEGMSLLVKKLRMKSTVGIIGYLPENFQLN
nr:hypothetical protein [Nanoarchaeum sp.]